MISENDPYWPFVYESMKSTKDYMREILPLCRGLIPLSIHEGGLEELKKRRGLSSQEYLEQLPQLMKEAEGEYREKYADRIESGFYNFLEPWCRIRRRAINSLLTRYFFFQALTERSAEVLSVFSSEVDLDSGDLEGRAEKARDHCVEKGNEVLEIFSNPQSLAEETLRHYRRYKSCALAYNAGASACERLGFCICSRSSRPPYMSSCLGSPGGIFGDCESDLTVLAKSSGQQEEFMRSNARAFTNMTKSLFRLSE